MTDATPQPLIEIRDITMAYGSNVIQRDLNFTINQGDIFVIMGGSGCGKSTLLKHMLGLIPPSTGDILYGGTSFFQASAAQQGAMRQRWGITYQSGGLFSAMTLAENITLPLELYTRYTPADITDIVAYKLALVGLAGYQSYYPSEISGGMQKRAALARAIALDPNILFFDEPSAGLSPKFVEMVFARLSEIRNTGLTIVLVEQNARAALAVGDRAYVLVEGREAHEGPAATLWNDPVVAELYLGHRRQAT